MVIDNWKTEALLLDKEGWSGRKIGAHLGIPKSTVALFLKRWKDGVEDKQAPLTPKQKEKLKRVSNKWSEFLAGQPQEFVSCDGYKRAGYSSILCIPDMHAPYHHPKTLEFLTYLKEKYKPDKIVCGGDEADKHSLSYHEKDPDLMGALCELDAATEFLGELYELFPEIDLLESNHGSLVYRKGRTAGLPSRVLRSLNEIYMVGDGWKWHFDLTLPMSNGKDVYFHHARSGVPMRTSKAYGINTVEFHHHEKFSINYYATPKDTVWAVQSGCLVDEKHRAFAYGKNNVHIPVLGCTVIVDGYPVLESLNKWLDEQNKGA